MPMVEKSVLIFLNYRFAGVGIYNWYPTTTIIHKKNNNDYINPNLIRSGPNSYA